MTIIKPQVTEKKPDSELPLAEVVFDDLPEKKEEIASDVESSAGPVTVLAIRRRRRFNACAIIVLLCIIILACIGGIFLYKHFAPRRMRFFCTATFDDELQPMDEALNPDKLIGATTPGLRTTAPPKKTIKVKEEIDIDVNNNVEMFHVPRVGPYRPIQVVYDFEKNLTAIFDKEQQACFVKPLNRSLVKPPKSLLDFLMKLHNDYYIRRSRVSREDYYIEKPAVEDVSQFGLFIFDVCGQVPTFRLRKIEAMPTPMAQASQEDQGSSSEEDEDEDSDDDGDMMGMMNGHRRGRHGHRGRGRHGPRGRHGQGHHGMMDRKKRSVAEPFCFKVENGAAQEELCIYN